MKEELQDIFYELARKGWAEDVDKITQEIERLQDMDKILRNENINLKLRINKALEYITNNFVSYEDTIRDLGLKVSYPLEIGTDEIGELLEILKGSDKE